MKVSPSMSPSTSVSSMRSAMRQEQVENLRAADDGDGLVPGQRQRLVHAVRDLGALGATSSGSRVRTMWRRPGSRPGRLSKVVPAHDHDAAHGEPFEALEVGGDVPGQGAVAPDHAVGRPGDDQGDRRLAHAFIAAVIR